ncbi:hypothetical protein BKA65DRAFT_476950 [Rhexocercosporidium sp. MPI-PUGE-AT-0058]|nr:hypothetical protein BKA65DRAFT_476950 [Rhexocercosporidium sp. MPI-PUGE-AT-0058]
MDEDIEHFVRNGKMDDPDFPSKLAEFSCDRVDTYRGASPTDDFRRYGMLAWEFLCYEGDWIKPEDVKLHQREARDREEAERIAQQQQARGHTQLHPAQLKDELACQFEYGHADFDDEYAQGVDSGFEDDFRLNGSTKGRVSKKSSPKLLNSGSTIRLRASSSSKSKRETKQQKMDREIKKNDHRSCFDLCPARSAYAPHSTNTAPITVTSLSLRKMHFLGQPHKHPSIDTWKAPQLRTNLADSGTEQTLSVGRP